MNSLTRPEGIAPEVWHLWEQNPAEASRRCDLYSLWESMTALAQETRLHARQAQKLAEPVTRELSEMRRALEKSGSDARRQGQSELLDPLLETRERLARGLACARQAARRRPRWLRWLRPRVPVLEALEQGYRLSLEGLEETLRRLGVEELRCRGEIFDPKTMTAVEVTGGSGPEDTVLEVHRPGYRWRGELYRTAQVKVARAQTPI